MKYSQTIGVIFSIVLIGLCFLPWTYIASQHITVTGFSAAGTNYGKPGLLNCILCVIMIICFLVPAIWAKRTNVFISALNLAWSFRNYLLLSACMMGECPEKQFTLIAALIVAVVILLMALLPRRVINN